jgi:hypothetical protein
MNDQEKFEQQLRKQPFRSMPTEWRSQILSSAGAECKAGRAGVPQESRPQGTPRYLEILRGLLWPHPVAWGALAAVWLLIAGVNWSVRDEGFAGAASSTAQVEPQQLRALLAEQKRLLTELVDGTSLPAEPADTRPRSARMVKTICV